MIHEIVRTLFKLLFSKDIDKEKDICLTSEAEEMYNSLIRMIDNGHINLAENSLIDSLNLPFYGASDNVIACVGIVLVTVQTIALTCSIFPTENALKKTFTDEGVPR